MNSLFSKTAIFAMAFATLLFFDVDARKPAKNANDREQIQMGPGPVTAISYNYNQLPSQVRSFLSSNYGSQSIKGITYYTLAGRYKIEFKNDAEIVLNKDCKIFEMEAANKRSISKSLLEKALPSNAITFLTDKKLINHVEEFKLMRNGTYKVQTDKSTFFGLDKKERTIFFDKKGNKKLNIRRSTKR